MLRMCSKYAIFDDYSFSTLFCITCLPQAFQTDKVLATDDNKRINIKTCKETFFNFYDFVIRLF